MPRTGMIGSCTNFTTLPVFLRISTALHCAASRGQAECCDTLLALCGASVDEPDINGCSALFYATSLGHADCTALLLKYGAQPNLQDRKGRT